MFQDLFTLFSITELKETTLGANMLLEENVRLSWPGSSTTDDQAEKRDVDDLTVTLQPMQIRTFLATVSYN
jgi:lysosomal alpha-mannosidase